MLLISILLGLIPLAGIGWIVVSGTITTVDGLFESIIMLSISGVFFLNVFWELRDRGLFGKSKRHEKKWPVFHPRRKMATNRNFPRKILPRSLPRLHITRCLRATARSF